MRCGVGRNNLLVPARHAAFRAAGLALLLLAAGCSHNTPSGPPQFAELMPTPMMQAAVPPPPVAAEPAPAMAVPPPPPAGPIYGGHLASYTREQDALNGWNIIVRQQSSIGSLKRHLVRAQTPRGNMIRLIAGDFPTADEAARFCAWAKQQNLYCAVMQLGPNDATSAPVPLTTPARRTRRGS